MGVQGHVAVVGVLPHHHHPPRVAGEAQGLGDRRRAPGGLDGDVGAAASGVLPHPLLAGVRRVGGEVQGRRGPMASAAARRAAGAPMTMTSFAPWCFAKAAAESPTGPLPSTSTDSAMRTSARSTAWSAVGREQPPAMKAKGSTPFSRMQRTPA